jgi:hypothetical protein
MRNPPVKIDGNLYSGAHLFEELSSSRLMRALARERQEATVFSGECKRAAISRCDHP